MQGFADRWTAQLGADTEAEEALIRGSALAYARLERCRKVEEATLSQAARDAVDRWEKKQRHAARRLAQNLSRDPMNTVLDLESTSFGCEWLSRHWVQLDAKLEQGITWDRDDMSRALLLLGYHPQKPGPDADADLRAHWHLVRVCSGAPGDPLTGQPTHPVPARLDLRARIARELDRLDALRDRRWLDHDADRASAVAQLALIDTTKDGQLRQRYRREAYSEMLRGINQLMRLRVERSRDQDRQWHQAHPHASRRRVADTPSTNPGFPDLAPMPASEPPTPAADPARPQPAPPPNSRNEPQNPYPNARSDSPNPQHHNTLRRGPSPDLSSDVSRTEPRFPVAAPRPDGPLPTAEAPRSPQNTPWQP
jgi:hypothetical protein